MQSLSDSQNAGGVVAAVVNGGIVLTGSSESIQIESTQTAAGFKLEQSMLSLQAVLHIHAPSNTINSCKQMQTPTVASQVATPEHCSSIKHGPDTGVET
jgi:hypothetical protein